MNVEQHKGMKLRTVYNAVVNGHTVKVRRPDSGGIIDYDEPTRAYTLNEVTLTGECDELNEA